MHVLKLVNKRKRSTRMPLLNDGAWISCDLVSGRWRHFQGGVARPVVHAPIPWLHPHVKTVPQSETRRNVKRKVENGIASTNLTEMQYKSSVANKLVDMAMENMYCNIIAFALFHLYFAILYFCLQKVHYCFSILSFSFAKLYFLLHIYVALFWLHSISQKLMWVMKRHVSWFLGQILKTGVKFHSILCVFNDSKLFVYIPQVYL